MCDSLDIRCSIELWECIYDTIICNHHIDECLNYPSYLTIVSQYVYLPYVYRNASILPQLPHRCDGYSADMVQKNRWNGRCTYDIALLMVNIGATF